MDTWPDEYAAAHGTGQTWMPGTYDPELNLYYFGTGNPNPVMAEKSRKGDNLYTCSIVALNPDTGKMAWYYQVSPHDVHDWDAVETPVLIDGEIGRQARANCWRRQAATGTTFCSTAPNGEHLVTTPFIDTLNWATSFNKVGAPIGDPKKYPTTDGVLVSPASGGATNWPAPSFDPETGLLYVGTSRTYSMFYLTDTDERPEGWGGLDRVAGTEGAALLAIDYKTGKPAWQHEWPSGNGVVSMLTTAGRLLFTSNNDNAIAFNPRQRQDSLAFRTHRRSQRRHDHLYGGWQAIFIGGRRRHALLLQPQFSGLRMIRTKILIYALIPLGFAMAQQKDSSQIDANGTAYVTRVVPVPDTISPEAQKMLSHVVSDAAVPQTLEQRRTGTDKWQSGAGDASKKIYPANVESSTIAGVPVRIVTPLRIPADKSDRVLINLHGGGFNSDSRIAHRDHSNRKSYPDEGCGSVVPSRARASVSPLALMTP